MPLQGEQEEPEQPEDSGEKGEQAEQGEREESEEMAESGKPLPLQHPPGFEAEISGVAHAVDMMTLFDLELQN
jgi:hypothetical protein